MTKEQVRLLPLDLIATLPKGAIKEISEKTGLDRNSVRFILRGHWNNPDVISEAIFILERQIEESTRIIDTLKTNLGSIC
jgi:hypothetical protein